MITYYPKHKHLGWKEYWLYCAGQWLGSCANLYIKTKIKRWRIRVYTRMNILENLLDKKKSPIDNVTLSAAFNCWYLEYRSLI